eukprot:scaffold1143_cov96-Cylindrotheca_fusiformis.AAC.9
MDCRVLFCCKMIGRIVFQKLQSTKQLDPKGYESSSYRPRTGAQAFVNNNNNKQQQIHQNVGWLALVLAILDYLFLPVNILLVIVLVIVNSRQQKAKGNNDI